MIISGKNSVYEALNASKTINKVMIANYIHDEFSKKIVDKCKQNKVRFDFVDKKQLDKLAEHNQGYVAEVTDFNYSTLEDILDSIPSLSIGVGLPCSNVTESISGSPLPS